MEINEDVYAEGFNAGYMIAKYKHIEFETIMSYETYDPSDDDYITGFKEGQLQCKLEEKEEIKKSRVENARPDEDDDSVGGVLA